MKLISVGIACKLIFFKYSSIKCRKHILPEVQENLDTVWIVYVSTVMIREETWHTNTTHTISPIFAHCCTPAMLIMSLTYLPWTLSFLAFLQPSDHWSEIFMSLSEWQRRWSGANSKERAGLWRMTANCHCYCFLFLCSKRRDSVLKVLSQVSEEKGNYSQQSVTGHGGNHLMESGRNILPSEVWREEWGKGILFHFWVKNLKVIMWTAAKCVFRPTGQRS